ncbi:MAG: SCO family protein [Bacteroidales bacterium]
MRFQVLTLFGLFFIFTNTLHAQADYAVDSTGELLGIYEKLDQYVPDSVYFYNEEGELVNFKNMVDKPTIVTMVYFTCPGICSPLLDGIADVIGKTDLELGKDYQVLTVSFNELETPELAKSKKKNYVKQVRKEIDESHWQWMTGDSASIHKLTNSMGYRFKREGNDFIHAAAIMVLSPEGKITRYLYGTYFLPFDLKMAIVEAAEGRSGPTINKILNYCFSYDPEGKKYVFNITKVAGTIILVFAVGLLLYLILSKRKRLVHKSA